MKALLSILAVSSTCFSQPSPEQLQPAPQERNSVFNLVSYLNNEQPTHFFNHLQNTLLTKEHALTESVKTAIAFLTGNQGFSVIRQGLIEQQNLRPETEIEALLHREARSLSQPVINKVSATLQCAKQYQIGTNDILTIIDYSLPSSEKRLWIFDLKNKKLLFHTYVSHGIKSGALLSNYFSNKHDSKASSIGVYKTEQAYYGREGISLKLEGLDKGFNDNAYSRSVVMHGGWYMDENFIKRYGRAGRSWGCPAVPLYLSKAIINTIKDKSLFVIYYPSDDWFSKSKFLHCKNLNAQQQNHFEAIPHPPTETTPEREEILFADLNKNNHYDENKPIAVMAADSYERIFHTRPPLGRMLRRQINHAEYIALSNAEFQSLIADHNKYANNPSDGLNEVYWVIPHIKMIRGYYETQMKFVNLGKIKEAYWNVNLGKNNSGIKGYTVNFDTRPLINLRTTNRFIRWVGL